MQRKLNDLFGSMRMILPEHKAAILDHNSERGLVEKPYIDEDEIGEMCFRIYDSTQYDYAIDIKWFKPVKGELGIIESTWGTVREIDVNRKRFKVTNDWDSQWINIDHLVSVTK